MAIITRWNYQDSEIEDDSRLYRITSDTYARAQFLLNGQGSKYGAGRFHQIHQLTSYVADNVLLCIAEKLSYMTWRAFRELSNNSYPVFKDVATTKDSVLVVFKCAQLLDLVHIDSTHAHQRYQLNPSTVVHPDRIYKPLQDVSNTIRSHGTGIVSPSARHSEGYSTTLFWDKTSLVSQIEAKLKIVLSLVSEDLSMLASDPSFDPADTKISQTIGYFKFDDDDFNNYNDLLEPCFSKVKGLIDFYRASYDETLYPDCAIKKSPF